MEKGRPVVPFEPDIVVTTPEEPHLMLVVEAKTSLPDLERTEADLKQYMVQMQCPVGALVTPRRMWLYRDFYTSRTPGSVRRVGEYDVGAVWRQPPPMNASAFETFVQRWLEELAKTPVSTLPDPLRDAVRENILPAVTTGDVRAAHPRYA